MWEPKSFYHFAVFESPHGVWFCHCKEHVGLMVTGHSMSLVMSRAEAAMRELQRADAEGLGRSRPCTDKEWELLLTLAKGKGT